SGVMPTERREGAIRVGATGQRATGGARRFQRKAAVFGGWHEPDESRGSCPDLLAARGETPRADSANPHVRVCEGWGRQRPHLLGRSISTSCYPRFRSGASAESTR